MIQKQFVPVTRITKGSLHCWKRPNNTPCKGHISPTNNPEKNGWKSEKGISVRDIPDFHAQAGTNPKKLSLIPQNGP